MSPRDFDELFLHHLVPKKDAHFRTRRLCVRYRCLQVLLDRLKLGVRIRVAVETFECDSQRIDDFVKTMHLYIVVQLSFAQRVDHDPRDSHDLRFAVRNHAQCFDFRNSLRKRQDVFEWKVIVIAPFLLLKSK